MAIEIEIRSGKKTDLSRGSVILSEPEFDELSTQQNWQGNLSNRIDQARKDYRFMGRDQLIVIRK